MKNIFTLLLTLLISTTFSFSQVNLKNGLVACYPFNGNANDATGNGHNGTVNGASLTTDRFGKANSAYNFDGSSYIQLSNPDDFKTNTYTYSAWVNASTLPVSGEFNSVIGVSSGQVLGLGYLSGSVWAMISYYTFASVPTYDIHPSTTVGANIGNWHHLVVVRSLNQIKLYVDGNLERTSTATISPSTPIYTHPNPAVVYQATIGTRPDAGNIQFFKGKIDDAYIYDRAITTEEVTALYQSTKSPSTVDLKNGLVACYPFNGNANDESSNGNNGTVNGATLTTDRFGKANSAYSFDGTSDFIEISPDKLQTATFSYSTWIKPKSLPESGIAFFIFSLGSDSGDQGIGLNNGYANGTDGFTGGGYLDIGENAFCQKGTLPNVNQWYHVVVVRDADTYKVYLDGTLMCSTTTLTKPPFYGTGIVKATIGSRWNNQQFSDCVLDDLHLYNRPLTADEVKALYDGNAPQTITISSNNSAPCGGDKITYTANGATNTSKYQWKVDGVNQGTNSKFFEYTSVNKSVDYQVKITVEVTDDNDICFPNKISLTEANMTIKNCTPCVLACHPFNIRKTK